jgi:hypothetical protein
VPGAAPVVFYAFDLFMLQGRDLRLSRLEERRKRLRKIVDQLPENIRYSETFAVPAATVVRVVRENGLESIVAKRAGSRYRSGRSGDWLPWRANRGQETRDRRIHAPHRTGSIRCWSATTKAAILSTPDAFERVWRTPGERCSLISQA